MWKMQMNDDNRDRLVNSMAMAAIVLILLTMCAFVDFITGGFLDFNKNGKTEIVTVENNNIKTNNKNGKLADTAYRSAKNKQM